MTSLIVALTSNAMVSSPSLADRCQRGREPAVRGDGSVEVPLTQGQIALVDSLSYVLVRDRLWYARWFRNARRFYAATMVRSGGRQRCLPMHRLIAAPPSGLEVDHIDHDTLNNLRGNLRVVTTSENQHNRGLQRGSSRFKGVTWHKSKRIWQAQITYAGRSHSLGHFREEEDAARAYDRAAVERFGGFAFTNEKSGLFSETDPRDPPLGRSWSPGAPAPRPYHEPEEREGMYRDEDFGGLTP